MAQAKDKAILDILKKKSAGTVAIFDKGVSFLCLLISSIKS